MTIKEMRTAAGLSQSQLLSNCPHNVSKPLLSAMENGLCAPTRAFRLWVENKCRNTIGHARIADSEVITADCRVESLRRLDKRTRKLDILSVLTEPMSAREIAYKLGYKDLNSVKPRLTELRDAGIVEVVGKKEDPVTDRKVSIFRRMT